jgi:DNA-binding NarL/FixJ family response regulator
VLLAEEDPLVRAGLRVFLDGEDGISVAGEAMTGEEAVAQARAARPDVVLVDAGLPGLNVVEAIRQLLSDPGAPVVLRTACEGDEQIFSALRAGASAVLSNDADPAELIRAIEVVARGDALLSPRLLRRVIAEVTARPAAPGPTHELVEELTAREREVVGLVALGLTNHEIAERLVVSPATARTHVSRATLKLHARDRAQLVALAYETGLAPWRGSLNGAV